MLRVFEMIETQIARPYPTREAVCELFKKTEMKKAKEF
jgi:hypothetical protein